MIPRFRVKGDRAWRHMALQFDEISNKMNFFLDGVLAISDDSPLKEMRETDQVTPGGFDTALLLGHADPGYRCCWDYMSYDI